MCGPPYEILPKQDNPHADPNLIGQFIEVLIQYWQNGGSIVFWAEGDPLFYQVNLFLEKAPFKELGNKCSELRICGDHKGENILLGDETGNLLKPKTFNRKKQKFDKCQRTSLSHNLGKIFEGITISYAQNPDKMKPFIPFSRDSEGGISSMYYPSDTTNGDIIIDCGYSKCFTQMRKDGTFRYVQNIAAWTARPEVHKWIDKYDKPNEWRPKAIKYEIQLGIKWNNFLEQPIHIRNRVFAIDTSGSVSGKYYYYKEVDKIIKKFYKPGDKIFTWSSDYKEQTYEEMMEIISERHGEGITASDLIADISRKVGEKLHDHLIIITDGMVGFKTVNDSDKKMENYNIKYKYVTTFVINDTDTTVDLSVGAAYSRGCPNETYHITPLETKKVSVLFPKDLVALCKIKLIETLEQFNKNYQALERAVQAKTIGTVGDELLKDDLLKMKKKINNDNNNDFLQKWNVLYKLASGALKYTFKFNDIAAAKKRLPKDLH